MSLHLLLIYAHALDSKDLEEPRLCLWLIDCVLLPEFL